MAWRQAIETLRSTGVREWAVTGSAALALHGLPAEPGDLDIVATPAASAALERALATSVTGVQQHYVRADLAADRRVTLVLTGTDVEILVGPSNPGALRADFDGTSGCVIDGVPVFPLDRLRAIYEAMGRVEVVRAIDVVQGEGRTG